ncbi:MAG: hypothetical protein M3R27_00405 [Bacteroidota bacterium]|nr:hypothetical protein [Bacteroidota bacterium]
MKTLKFLRSKLLEVLTHNIALPLISRFRNKPKFPYTSEQLLEFPDGTLGKDLILYLQKMNFKLLPNYEQHDCKHIILGYEMDEVGEARMQFYFLGNRHYSLPVLSTVIMCFILMPEHWKQFRKDFIKGRISPVFDEIDYGQIVHLPTSVLRNQFKSSNYENSNG